MAGAWALACWSRIGLEQAAANHSGEDSIGRGRGGETAMPVQPLLNGGGSGGLSGGVMKDPNFEEARFDGLEFW